MNREETMPALPRQFGLVDVVAVERQARAMQARMMADMLRTGWRWLSARVRRAPQGQTA